MNITRTALLALAFVQFTPLVFGGYAVSEDQFLTEEETIAILFVPRVPGELYLHANPAAREAVASIFDDTFAREVGPSTETIAMLGFIGNDTDAERLLRFVESKKGRVGSEPNSPNAINALGRMACRGVSRAKEILASMAEKPYWEALNMRTLPETLYSLYPELITINSVQARYLLDISEGRPLRPVEDVLKEMYPQYEREEEARKRFVYNISIARKFAEILLETQVGTPGFKPDSDLKDALERGYREHYLRITPPTTQPNPLATQKQPPESPEAMMLTVVTPRGNATEEDKAYYSELAREATETFYDFFVTRVNEGDIEALKGRILDDGKPHAPLMVRNYWSDTAQELERTQRPILEALKKAGAKPDFDQFAAGTAEDGSFIVKIPIPGTSSIVLERWNEAERREQLDGTFTISPTYDLVLVMRKIDGVWYWNPFGW